MNYPLLIIESGATKTDWVLLGQDKNRVTLPCTEGLNPFHTDLVKIKQIFEQQSIHYKHPVSKTYFYGSGYKSFKNKLLIEELIKKYFRSRRIFIYHDILAVVHALNVKKGICIILGTGSNACEVKNGRLCKQMSSSGFLLGDEGSASHIAKSLIKAYVENILPPELKIAFQNQYDISPIACLELFYKQQIDKAYISHYAHFASQHLSHKYIKNLILESFKTFFNQLKKQSFNLTNKKIFATGSIAYHFKPLFLETLKQEEAILVEVLEKPIEGLIKYHQEHNIL